VLERAWILSDGGPIRTDHLAHLSGAVAPTAPPSEDENLSLEAAEKRHILEVLKRFRGRVPEAAEKLGISKPTLYRKISEHGIDLKELK